MSRLFLVIVEGPHDAAFVGVELRDRGFTLADRLDDVLPYWIGLFPRTFPARSKLRHVVAYPDVWNHANGDSCAVVVAEGETKLLSELRVALEILDVSALTGIAVIADADEHTASHRFGQILAGIKSLNAAHGAGGSQGAASLTGFPLSLPAAPGDVTVTAPRIGVYVMPDNAGPGTLDTLLLECADASLADLKAPAAALVAQVNDTLPDDDRRFRLLRKPFGRAKATAGVIGNLLLPGCALSVAIDKGPWLDGLTGHEVGINAFRRFVDDLFA